MENSKSKVAAGVLGLLLGGLGIHNFYLGYTKKAIIQLGVQLGAMAIAIILYILSIPLSLIVIGVLLIPIAMVFNGVQIGIGVWGFVEGIMILCGKIDRDADGNMLV